jgi:predicted nucleic acid-binding protein
MAFLRIGTHPGIFPQPLSWDQAAGYVEALINLPHARLLSELDGFWPVYRSVAGGVFARGNLIPDAHLAAILKQNGVRTLYTSDTDFRKFDFLDVRDPFD